MWKRFCLIGLATLTLLLLGCGGGGGTSSTDPRIYFINGSIDSGTLHFLMDDESAFANAGYLDNSTDFDAFEFKGQDVDGWDVSVQDQTTAFAYDRIANVFPIDSDNIVIAHGLLNFPNGEEEKRLQLSVVNVNRTAPNGNKARLIVFHGLHRSPGNFTPSMVLKTPGQTAQFFTSDIAPGGNAVLNIDSGPQTLEAKRADTTGIFASKTINLDAGGVYLVIIGGIEGDPDISRQPDIEFIKLPAKA